MDTTENKTRDDFEAFPTLERARLNALYQTWGNDLIKPENGPVFMSGQKNKVVLLVHGFLGSTFELTALAHAINQNGQGPSVYLPLLEGFGSSTLIANHSSDEGWQKTVESALIALSREFQQIALAGFSLGGGLASALALNSKHINAEGFIRNNKNSRITSICLMAPYYGMHTPLPVSSKTLKWVSEKLFKSSRGINLKTLYTLSRIKDLKTVVANAPFYNTAFPLAAVGQINLFSVKLQNTDQRLRSNVPTLLALSEADQTVNIKLAEKRVGIHFPHSETIRLPKAEKVPHQFISPDVNPDFESISNSIRHFIIQHFN